MNTETLLTVKIRIQNLNRIINSFRKGAIDVSELKRATVPLGIYEQKNSLFMMRIRIPGGELFIKDAKRILGILKDLHMGKMHITTRQDLQIHDVPIKKLVKTAEKFLTIGMPFYGGGGDTLRNITACPHGIFDKKAVFDTVPYAKALTEFLFDYNKAFDLPRKFKIAISCNSDDYSMGKFTDLGFIAKIQNAERGFEVYAGGGMGRENCIGIKISDFIPETEIFSYAIAAINFFYERGNRNDRSRARFRFILLEYGADLFKKTFEEYLGKVRLKKNYLKKFIPAQRGIFCRLFIPHGNLLLKDFNRIIKIAENFGAEVIRFSQDQDIYIGPFVDMERKDLFLQQFPEFAGENINGLIKSCVGASVCRIGLLDSVSHATLLSNEISTLLSRFSISERKKLIEEIISNIKLSGCHNSCGLNRAVKFGFQGCKKNINGTMREFYIFQRGGFRKDGVLGINTGMEIAPEELPNFFKRFIEDEFLNKRRMG